MGHCRQTEHLVWCFTCSAMVTRCSTASHTMDCGSRLAHSRNWDASMADLPWLWDGEGQEERLRAGPHRLGTLVLRCTWPRRGHRGTHESEAAADAGLHVAAPEGCHLPELPRDLDGLVEQDAQVPLVTQAPGIRHLAEEVCGGMDRETAPQTHGWCLHGGQLKPGGKH